MKEKRNKPRYNAEFKTFNSQQSCIDVFSKVESLFLQKFFRYNLSDYFQDLLSNIEEDLFLKKIKHKQIKQLASECFLSKTNINLSEFQQKVNNFYCGKTDNIEPAEQSLSFKKVYSNCPEEVILKDELIFVQVRMRAEIQKIQSLPTYFYKELELCQAENNLEQKDQEELLRQLTKYKKNVINLFAIYFGDINFHLFNKEHYQPVTVNFFNRQVTVKIHAFYVSRIALLGCFKRLNKIQNLQYINDLLIQLYEFKREKAKAKKLRNSRARLPLPVQNTEKFTKLIWYLKWFSVVSVSMVGIGALILKFFF